MKKLLLIVFCLVTAACWSQERTHIHIEHANQLQKVSGSEAVRLLGDVHIRHDSTHFYCDSAYYYEERNSFDAFQNVHIKINDSVDMYSRTMVYDGDRRFAEFFDDVRMMDDSTLLVTEYMTYDRNRHLASYPDHGVTTRGDKKLVSEIGFYRDDIKEFRFFNTVEVTSPKYEMYTDTLYYNTRIETMWFQGGGLMKNENNQEIVSDSMVYETQKNFAKAIDHVQMTDTSYKVILRGNYAEVWEKLGFSFATDSAYVVYYDGGDSLYIASDTMFYHFKTELNEEEKLVGRRHVRFFKSDMQGKCDTITYEMRDSIIRMRVEPVLWNDDSQMTATTIDIKTANHTIDSLFQKGQAFIISKDSIEGYNQIYGLEMVSCFRDGELHHVNVTDSSKALTWLREDDGSLIGINISASKDMVVLIKDKAISRVKYFETIDETLYPEDDIKESERYLEGFLWLDDLRPKSPQDIFQSQSHSSSLP